MLWFLFHVTMFICNADTLLWGQLVAFTTLGRMKPTSAFCCVIVWEIMHIKTQAKHVFNRLFKMWGKKAGKERNKMVHSRNTDVTLSDILLYWMFVAKMFTIAIHEKVYISVKKKDLLFVIFGLCCLFSFNMLSYYYLQFFKILINTLPFKIFILKQVLKEHFKVHGKDLKLQVAFQRYSKTWIFSS